MQGTWSVFGHSLIGSSHIRKEMPNQDAFGYKNLEGDVQVLALSDGHGGAAHKYSDLGSQLAIETLIEVLEEYVVQLPNEISESKIRFDFEGFLSKKIQNGWLAKIQNDERYESPYQYGCTLLAVVKLNHFLVCLQLGDGKIAIVYEDGVVYYPMPRDLRFENNETASLSQPNAWAEIKVVIVPLEESIHMVALASDGVENAYPEDYYDDVHFFIRLASEEDTDVALKTLIESAARYSKDDTTVVLWKNEGRMHMQICSEEPIVWMGDYPKPWQPLACMTDCTLNQKVEYAILMVDALISYAWRVPFDLTLKQIYYDPDAKQMAFLESDEAHIISVAQICSMLSDLMGIEFTTSTHEKIKPALITLKRQLRYDYDQQSFVIGSSAIEAKSAVSLSGSNGQFEVFFNSTIYLHQLMPLTGNYDGIVGEVIQHEKHKGVWGLVNKTDHVWRVFGSSQTTVSPNKTLTIQSGITVFLFGLPIKFNINNG